MHMVNLLLCGCNGRMGRIVTACVKERCDCDIVAGVDLNTESPAGYPVYANPRNCMASPDVVIDFSHPSALEGVLAYAKERRIPVVIAATGYTEEQTAKIRAAAAEIPVFFSANMSMGVNLLAELCRKAAAVLGNDFDVEIIEKHHNQKVDAPSGTALMLAKAVEEGLDYEPTYVYDRHAVRQKRDKKEIGFSSIRGGNIVGEHEVLFAGHDEVVTISHSARSKEVFAVGAVNAALFLVGKPAGMYTMTDLVSAL